LITGEKREEQGPRRSQGAQGQFGPRAEGEQYCKTRKTESGTAERMFAQRIGKSQLDPVKTRWYVIRLSGSTVPGNVPSPLCYVVPF